jgi:hypothetical protein
MLRLFPLVRPDSASKPSDTVAEMPIGAALYWDDDPCEVVIRPSGEDTYLVSRIRGRGGRRQRVRAGVPDASLTGNAGLAAVSERDPGRPLAPGASLKVDLQGRGRVHHDLPRRGSGFRRPGELNLPAGLHGHRGARRDLPGHGRDGLNALPANGVSDVVEVDQM